MIKKLLCLCALIAIAFMPAAMGAGETYEVYNCNEFITLREHPSVKAEGIAKIPLYALVTRISGTADGFMRVAYLGTDGYALAEYLRPVDLNAFYAEIGYGDGALERVDRERLLTDASTFLTDQYGTYPAENLIDGDAATAWAEGAPGAGDGQWVSISVPGITVAGIAIRTGYQKSEKTFADNARPKEISVVTDLGGQATVTLGDTAEEQYIMFNRPVTLRGGFTLTVQSVYSGQKYEDACISEIGVLIARPGTVAAYKGADDREITGELSRESLTDINRWLSHFTMTDLTFAPVRQYEYAHVPFDAVSADNARLVRFGIYHNFFMNNDACLTDTETTIDGYEYYWRISYDDVNAAATRFFGRTVEKASTVEFPYRDGWFYFDETGGSCPEGVAVVTNLYDIGDGLYRAVLNRYADAMTTDDLALCAMDANDISARWLGVYEAVFTAGDARVLLAYDEY